MSSVTWAWLAAQGCSLWPQQIPTTRTDVMGNWSWAKTLFSLLLVVVPFLVWLRKNHTNLMLWDIRISFVQAVAAKVPWFRDCILWLHCLHWRKKAHQDFLLHSKNSFSNSLLTNRKQILACHLQQRGRIPYCLFQLKDSWFRCWKHTPEEPSLFV